MHRAAILATPEVAAGSASDARRSQMSSPQTGVGAASSAFNGIGCQGLGHTSLRLTRSAPRNWRLLWLQCPVHTPRPTLRSRCSPVVFSRSSDLSSMMVPNSSGWVVSRAAVKRTTGCRCPAKASSLIGQQKCQIHIMKNVTLTQIEQARLQVLNSLLAEHVTLDQAATLMGVTTRHTRRILAAYREKGRSRRRPWPPGPQASQRDVRSSDRRRGPSGSHQLRRNQPHPSQRVAAPARGHRHRPDHPAAHPGQRRSE